MMTKSVLVKTYVNCVKFFNDNFLLASAGNMIEIYNIRTSQLVNRVMIFKNQRIHGVVVQNKMVLIYGGCCIALVQVIEAESIKRTVEILVGLEIAILRQWTAQAWVIDVSLFDNNSYAVLGSTNVLYLFKLSHKGGNSDAEHSRVGSDYDIILEKLEHCKEKSVLYSGKILGTQWSNTIVLCGTVFSQITIWSPLLNKCNIIHRLLGHQGVIFSVSYHFTNRTLVSTSDDRTLRVWQVEMHETEDKLSGWAQATIKLTHSIFGHTARVWRNLQLTNGRIISIGEDGQLRVWKSGKCVRYWNTHQNGNVWSLDYNESLKLIVTGGGDAGICVWPLNEEENYSEPRKINLAMSDEDFPRQVVVAKNKKLLIFTNKGTLICYDRETSRTVLQDKRFTSYCVLSLSQNKQYFSIGSIHGDLLIFNETDALLLCEYNVGKHKIFSLHWLTNDTFVVCIEEGKLTLFRLEYDLLRVQECTLKHTHNLVLPICKERWLTSAVLVNKDLFVCGDRDGSVHVYNLNVQSLVKTFYKIHSRLGVSCIAQISENRLVSIGRDGFLRHWEVIKDETDREKSTYDMGIGHEQQSLHLVSSDKLPVEWPAHVVNNGQDTYIIGFNEVNLIIWSTQEQKIIFKLKCGGGHRSWDCFLHESQFYFSFIKQKQVFNIDIDLSEFIRPAIVQSFHRDEINACKVIRTRKHGPLIITGGEDNTLRVSCLQAPCGVLIAGGCEPNQAVVPQPEASLTLRTCLILRSHISSIRCINYLSVDGNIIIVSAGGRAQLKIWKLNQSELTIDKTAEAKACDKVENDILYGNNLHNTHLADIKTFDSNSVENESIDTELQCKELFSHMLNGEDRKDKSWRSIAPRINPETRYMDITCYNIGHLLYITAACSDGFIRIFSYDINNNVFELEKQLDYHKKCVLKVHILEWENEALLFSMSTDGVLAIWDYRELVKCKDETFNQNVKEIVSKDDGSEYRLEECCKANFRLHQGGINSFDCKIIQQELVLVSGGDDCSIVLCVFNSNLTRQKHLTHTRGHDSQITGLVFLNDEQFVTSSVDQKIIVWTWQDQQLVKLRQHVSCVPDLHGLALLTDAMLCVHGCGLDVINIISEDPGLRS